MNILNEAKIIMYIQEFISINSLIYTSKLINNIINFKIIIDKEKKYYELKKQLKINLKICFYKIIEEYWKCFYNINHYLMIEKLKEIFTKVSIQKIGRFYRCNKYSKFKINESNTIFNRKTYEPIKFIIFENNQNSIINIYNAIN